MNKKIVGSLILIITLIIIIFINTKQNNIEVTNQETPSQEISKINNTKTSQIETSKKDDLINKRIKDLRKNKPTEKPNLKGLVPENLEELRYEEEHGRLHKIEDQSYVNLDRKEVYLDYEHQIDRFENEFVDQTLDVALPNHFYEQAMSNPVLYERVMEVEPELLNNEPRYIVNYAFFQYIKPNEMKMLLFDMSINLANSFEFFYFKDGINLKKIIFENCNQYTCLNEKEGLSIIFHCSETECKGSIDNFKKSDSFILDENGKLFIYNNLDEKGNKIFQIQKRLNID